MPSLRACPACGSEDTRRSRRRNARDRLFSLAGVFPYVCNNCRNRYWSLRDGSVYRTLGVAVILAMVVALAVGAVWFYNGQKRAALLARTAPAPSPALPSPRDFQLREQVEALANRLVEVRREKAALQAELAALRRQLAEMTKAPPAVAPSTSYRPAPLPQVAAPAPPPPPPPAPRPLATGKTLLGRVTFASGSTAIDEENQALLKGIAQRLTQSPGDRVLLVGAADATPMGSRTASMYYDNTGLAMARALSVFRALRGLGVEETLITVTASGAPDMEVGAGRMVKIWLLPAGRGGSG